MFKQALVFRGNPHQHHPPAGPGQFHRLPDGRPTPRRFKNHIDFRVRRQRLRAQFLCQLHPPRQWIAHVNFGGSGQPDRLNKQQPNRPGPNDSHPVADPNLGEIRGMQRHSQRFQ